MIEVSGNTINATKEILKLVNRGVPLKEACEKLTDFAIKNELTLLYYIPNETKRSPH